MLAAYTFESALELSEFCARHDIAGGHTYAVLQSMVPCTRYGEHSVDVRLTLVLDLMEHVLERIKEDESDYQKAYREQLRREEESYEAPKHADAQQGEGGASQARSQDVLRAAGFSPEGWPLAEGEEEDPYWHIIIDEPGLETEVTQCGDGGGAWCDLLGSNVEAGDLSGLGQLCHACIVQLSWFARQVEALRL